MLVDAVGLRMGGGAAVLQGIIAAAARSEADVSWEFFVSPRRARQFDLPDPAGAVLISECPVGDSLRERLLWTQWAFPRLARNRGADAVLCMANLGAARPRVPQLVLLAQSLYFTPAAVRRFPARDRVRWTLAKKLVVAGLRASRYVLVPIRALADAAIAQRAISKAQAVVVPFAASEAVRSGRSLPPFVWRVSELPRPRLLYVAHPTPYKNVETLLAGLALLREEVPSARLVLTMRSPDDVAGASREDARVLGRYREAARRHGVEDQVVWTGVLAPDEALALYSECDVFVFASLAEAFPLPLVEAMACGRPMLLPDLPYAREIVGPAALYFDALDPASFATQAKRLVSDAALREDSARRALERSRAFSWDETLARTVEVLARAAGEAGRAGARTPGLRRG